MEGKCPKCGVFMSSDYDYCAKCGAMLRSQQTMAGKTAPMPIVTKPMHSGHWPKPQSEVPRTAVERSGRERITTGMTGPEAEAMVLDISWSTRDKGLRGMVLDDIKACGRVHILQKRHIDAQDKFAVVSFSDEAQIICDWTRLEDPSSILAGLDSLTPGGNTNFASGLERAEELFSRCPLVGEVAPLRKILFFSDGKNNIGDPLPIATSQKSAGVIIQTIGFGATENDVDANMLRRIASVIDGQEQYFFCSNLRGLTQTFKALSKKTEVFLPTHP